MIAKLLTIIKSRFRQQREEAWIKERRATCLECEYNSLNTTSTSLAHNFLATLSYFFSWIFGRADRDHKAGICTICTCPINLKIVETEEEYACPHPDGNKWEKVTKLNILKERQNANNKNNQ